MTFKGFPPGFFRFFAELAANNRKEWFEANRARYEDEVKAPLAAFTEALAPRLAKVSPHFVVDPKKSLFRIHRDTRFSPDKSPYKTNAGLQFRHAAGKDAHAPGFYVHLAADEVFYGGGLWRPEASALAAVREAIAADPKGWGKAKSAKLVAETFGGLDPGDPLARPPRGFPVDHPAIEDLKKRSFFLVRPATPAAAGKPAFVEEVAAACAAAKPVMAFLCAALDQPF